MLIRSGEIIRNRDGSPRTVEVETWWYERGERTLPDGSVKPVRKMFRQGVRPMPIMDFGYSLMTRAKDLDWGDCVGRPENEEAQSPSLTIGKRAEAELCQGRSALPRHRIEALSTPGS